MRGKLIAALASGLVIGFVVAPMTGRHQQARAEREDKAQQWEYKVGMVSVKGTDVMIGDSLEDEKAKKISALGADGWEYAGPMPIWDSDWSNSVVVFKRPKK